MESGRTLPEDAAEIANNWFVNQFDFTIDLQGFFCSFNFKPDYKKMKDQRLHARERWQTQAQPKR